MANWLNTVFAGFDGAIFNFMYNLQLTAGNFFTPFFKAITFLGEKGWFYIVIGLILLLFKRTRKIGLTLLISLGVGSLLTNLVIKNIISRPRPFTASDFYFDCWNIVGPTNVGKNSFPSGHSTAAAATTVAWILTSNKKYRFSGIAFALLMGLSRIYLFVHYPTDVIAGLIVGSLVAVGIYFIIKSVYKVIENNANNKVCLFILNASIVDLFVKKLNG